MLNKLEADRTKIPTPHRDDIMQMSAWDEATVAVDLELVFKQNAITIKLDGTEDHLVSTNLSALVMGEMREFRTKLLQSPVPKTIKQLQRLIIPPEGVKRNVTPYGDPIDEGNEKLDGEYFDEFELRKSKNVSGVGESVFIH